MKRERKVIKKEKDRYIDPENGRERNGTKKKTRKRSNWYKKGGNEAVIFVPATKNSQLPKRYQKEIKRQSGRKSWCCD